MKRRALRARSQWKMFSFITLPLLRPTVVFVLVTSVIGSFQIFDTIAVTTQGAQGLQRERLSVYLSGGVQQHAHGIRLGDVDGAVPGFSDCHPGSDAWCCAREIRPRLDLMRTPASPPSIGRWFGYAALILFAIISLGPLWIAFKTALTGPNALFGSGGSLLPQDPTLFNFQRVLGFIDPSDPHLAQTGLAKITFFRALLNSAIFTAMAVIPQIFFSATAAYAFARLRFPGRDVLFFLFIAATMIPTAVLFIPNFILIHDLGWLNTFQGMAAPYALMTPFAVFFLRQMFLATPNDVEEAARIDGASYFFNFLSYDLADT